MIEAAAANGWIDRERAVLETLTSIRRAGARIVLTYYALDVARAGPRDTHYHLWSAQRASTRQGGDVTACGG